MTYFSLYVYLAVCRLPDSDAADEQGALRLRSAAGNFLLASTHK